MCDVWEAEAAYSCRGEREQTAQVGVHPPEPAVVACPSRLGPVLFPFLSRTVRREVVARVRRKLLWIPADRLLHVLDVNGVTNVDLSQAGIRRVFGLRNGEARFISLDAADRILTKVGLQHWFHRPKADGGLADIYEDGAQYGRPSFGEITSGDRRARPCVECGKPARGRRCMACYRDRPRQPCGTRGAYKRGCRCLACCRASAAYQRELVQRRKEAA